MGKGPGHKFYSHCAWSDLTSSLVRLLPCFPSASPNYTHNLGGLALPLRWPCPARKWAILSQMALTDLPQQHTKVAWEPAQFYQGSQGLSYVTCCRLHPWKPEPRESDSTRTSRSQAPSTRRPRSRVAALHGSRLPSACEWMFDRRAKHRDFAPRAAPKMICSAEVGPGRSWSVLVGLVGLVGAPPQTQKMGRARVPVVHSLR